MNAGRPVGNSDGNGAVGSITFVGSLSSTSGGAEPVPRSMANKVTATKMQRQKTAVIIEKPKIRLLNRMRFRKQERLKAETSQVLAIAALLAR